MREYRLADIIGTARESFSDYGELAAMESWERSQLVRLGVSDLTKGIAVIPTEAGLEIMRDLPNEAEIDTPPPAISPLKAPSFFRR